ncbi:MAG TPA: hypothetical protein VG943_13445 [Caulobacterales bacterium]|nr:hypothetical protein [Caulobacterales bacterium]
MLLLDVNFTLRGPWDRDDERIELYRRAAELGSVAWASESQFYLLTVHEFGVACEHLGADLLTRDFLKVQEVTGRFFVAGSFPPGVNSIFERAQSLGLVSLYCSERALPALAARRVLR